MPARGKHYRASHEQAATQENQAHHQDGADQSFADSNGENDQDTAYSYENPRGGHVSRLRTRAKDPSTVLRITFTPPDGGDPRKWEFESPDADLTALEAELIEDAGGKQWDTFMGWAVQMASGSLRAVRVLLWTLLRREDPELDLEGFNFPVNALSVEELDDEQPAEPEGKDEPADSATSTP